MTTSNRLLNLLLVTTITLMLSACNAKTSQDESNASAVSTPVTGTTGDTEGTGEDTTPNEGSTDTMPPRIALNGKASITLDQDTPYTELGATAQDDVDGNVDVHIEGSVDSNTTGTYTITYSAKDKAGNESSVQREVKVVSKYKILITEKEGNTAGYGWWAYFTISLSHKPTHPVEIFIESDNPSEGIVSKREYRGWDAKTGRIVIQPEDWKSGKRIGIIGRNKNAINGKQDYHIVTSPAVSDDPRFDGVDAEDVHMVGEVLELNKPDLTHIPFVPNIETSFFIRYYTNGGHEHIVTKLLKAPEGMKIKGNKVVWKPNESDNGKNYNVVISISNGNLSAKIDFDISVVTLGEEFKTTIKDNIVTVESSEECSFADYNGKSGFTLQIPNEYKHYVNQIKIRQVIKSNITLPKYFKPSSCLFAIIVPDELNQKRTKFYLNATLPLDKEFSYQDKFSRVIYTYKNAMNVLHARSHWWWSHDYNDLKKTQDKSIKLETQLGGDFYGINSLYIIGDIEKLKKTATKQVVRANIYAKSNYIFNLCQAVALDENNLSLGLNYNKIT